MPTPRKGETQEHFVDRCMGDAEAVRDFPDADQRLAVCNSKWENRGKADISSGDLNQGGRLEPQGQARLCPPGHKYDPASDTCVPNNRPTLAEVKAKALVPVLSPCDCAAHAEYAARADGQRPLRNRQTRGHNDPFLRDELAMARELTARADEQADEVQKIYNDVLSDPVAFNLDAFNEATKDAQDTWQDTWNNATETSVLAAVVSALSSGERRISAGILSGVPSRQAVMDGMVRAAKFYTNDFFNSFVLPALQDKVAAVLDNAPPTGLPDLSAIRAILDRRLASVPYWRVVANSATSRSYHYGLLKAAQLQGNRAYVFTAVIDERTTKICRELNGRTWFIADALDLVERVAASDDPEEVKRLTPWVNFSEVEGQSNEALRAKGVIVPPVHGNCRSTITVL